jgi:hypothetical protein
MVRFVANGRPEDVDIPVVRLAKGGVKNAVHPWMVVSPSKS